MPDNPEVEDERPCLHCLMGDLIDEYYGEYGSPGGEADVIDVSEIMTSLAKIVRDHLRLGCRGGPAHRRGAVAGNLGRMRRRIPRACGKRHLRFRRPALVLHKDCNSFGLMVRTRGQRPRASDHGRARSAGRAVSFETAGKSRPPQDEKSVLDQSKPVRRRTTAAATIRLWLPSWQRIDEPPGGGG